MSTVMTTDRHRIIYSAEHLYSSHPCVCRLSSGELLVAFSQSAQREPFLHPPADPMYVNVLIRSHDEGATWSHPHVVPDYGWLGVETPGIAQLRSGRVLVNQYQFQWAQVNHAKRSWANGDRDWFVCDDAGAKRHLWRPALSVEDFDVHPYPYCRRDGNAWIQISDDGGRTWLEPREVDIRPYQAAFSPKGAVHLSNGDVLLALGSHDHDPLHTSFVVRSSDEGMTWSSPVEVARAPGVEFCEPSLTETPSGKLICISRDEASGFLYQTDSYDGGHTWSTPARLPLWGYPAHVLTLSDGRIFMVYGVRRPPFGIRAAVSADEGTTWSDELIIRDDFPNENLGYPSAVELSPGRLLVVYYGETASGTTVIHGTEVTLR